MHNNIKMNNRKQMCSINGHWLLRWNKKNDRNPKKKMPKSRKSRIRI